MAKHSAIILCLIILSSCGKPQGISYLDEHFPGHEPQLYAPGLVNVEGRFQQNITISANGKEQYITITDSAVWRYERILRLKQTDKGLMIDTPQFVKDFTYQNEWFIGEPMLSPDDSFLYFVADFPPDLWRSPRTKSGNLGTPEKLADVSTAKDDWYPSFASNGNLYFTNGTLYRAKPSNGTYQAKDSIQIPMKLVDVRDPYISPNEDFIVFAASEGSLDNDSDLYVSFKESGDAWSSPISLGADINSAAFELGPYISPDGQYLFFSRRDQWQNASYSNIYWVSMEVVEALRN